MRILKVRALRGPNIWSRHPVLEALVDLGPLRDSSSEVLPGFNDRLMSWLPSMIEHRCSIGERGGFFTRLRRGTYLAHILEHVTLELQTLAGNTVGFGRARETATEGVYKVAIKYLEESVGRAALDQAFELCLAAVYDRPYDIKAQVKKLHDLADKVCLGPSTAAIVDAARARNIPSRRLNSGSLVQLGYGAKQRRIWTAETDLTGAIAESIAQDKDLTKSMLRAAGVPVPEGRAVDSPADAWAAAQEIEAAVVVKPLDGNHGRGVFMNLESQDQVEHAYREAIKEGSGVLVERFAKGIEHRLLVVGSKLVAASCGDAAKVVGDGRQTIAELIESQVNADPRRGDDETFPLNTVLLSDPVVQMELARQKFTAKSVPDAGVVVIVRRNDNLSMDVTERVHPDNAEHAVLAAKVVGLDIAGVDIVTEDISIPLDEQGGVVVEVNAGPGLLMHLKPSIGQPQPVGEAIVETLFPIGESGRIPVAAVSGTNGKTTTSRMITSMLTAAGRHVGLTCSDGVFVNDRPIDKGDCAGPRSARNVLLNPCVDAAVFEVARGGILREGLGFDACDVAVITNIGNCDHLGQYYIDTPEQMFTVKRTPVDVVLPTGYAVLNATDALVTDMARLSAGGVIFFALDGMHPVLLAHREQGERVVFVQDNFVTAAEGGAETVLFNIAELPCTHGGRVQFQVENVLAAVGAGWGLRLSWEHIRQGLLAFQGNLDDAPGRFTVIEVAGRTLVVSDCRNIDALAATIEATKSFSATARSAVYSAEEDRREADIVEQGRLLAMAFDRVAICEIEAGRDRPQGEVTRLLEAGIALAETETEVVTISSWGEAVDSAWRNLEKGELLLVQTASIPQTVMKVSALLGLDGARFGTDEPSRRIGA
jgi:cyanophycin synthetase